MPLLELTAAATGPWLEFAEAGPQRAASGILVDFDRLMAEGGALAGSVLRLGVAIEPHHRVEALAPFLSKLRLIAINFPAFTDGRGYSQAARLRDEFGYGGELRAVGEILADQVRFMARAGFDSLELAPGVDLRTAKKALLRFRNNYQPVAGGAPTIPEKRHARHPARRRRI